MPEHGTTPRQLRFPGLSNEELMAEEAAPKRHLIEGVIEPGTVGTIAGLPETYKSWLALQIAIKTATGGSVLGRNVCRTGSVAYWWEDDSRDNEIARIQTYQRRHSVDSKLSIRWHLSEGLTLPQDMPVLRREIEEERHILVVLDSLYNFCSQLGLQDPETADVIARIKREICDETGCAVCIVDHSPWPTESNRGQRRPYGSVFKAAAIRWGIYLERTGKNLYVVASGNNVRGIERTPVLFDDQLLELTIVNRREQAEQSERELDVRVLGCVEAQPGMATIDIEKSVGGRRERIRDSLGRLHEAGQICLGPGRQTTGKYWYPSPSTSPPDDGATPGEVVRDTSRPARPALNRAGDGGAGELAERSTGPGEGQL